MKCSRGKKRVTLVDLVKLARGTPAEADEIVAALKRVKARERRRVRELG